MVPIPEEAEAEIARLRKRLERERQTRQEAEGIAEKAIRDLYHKQQALLQEIKERREVEEQLRQAQKMESVGRLTGGVAHDFNNLLTVIIGSTEFLLYTMPTDDPSREMLEEVRQAGERAAGLTRQLLAFSRKQLLVPVVLELNLVVTEVQRMLRRMIGAHIELTCVLEPALWLVRADPGQIEQVLMNLVVNARDAMPQGGRVLIETSNVEVGENPEARAMGLTSGSYVLLSVTDSGIGMDTETQAKIFEPFFTTKGVGKGTGLGLSTVFGIVKQCRGAIRVESVLGEGTTFHIYLPRVGENPSYCSSVHGVPRSAQGGNETILLVEDEAAVRSLGKLFLIGKGYTVLEASTADQALAIARQYPHPIALLVSDVIMPGMSGRALAERLVALRPGIRVLFVSGYVGDELGEDDPTLVGMELLDKPFTQELLTRKVREVLDASSISRFSGRASPASGERFLTPRNP